MSPNEISLPELMLGPVRYSCGYANKRIRACETAVIESSESVNVSARIKETVHKLNTGERIIVTTRKKINRPKGVDGVLLKDKDGKLSWKSHRLLEEMQEKVSTQGLSKISDEVVLSWSNGFSYKAETNPRTSVEDYGLRPPQLGALFAIGSHWSLHTKAATVVMPTGTGKTETMLATQIAHQIEKVLVVVPSKALRDQTAQKFISLGLLKKLNTIGVDIETPVVGVVTSRPRNLNDLKIFNDCNVVVGVVSSIADGSATNLIKNYERIMDVLFIDEAHHVPAKTWSGLKESFTSKRILQFTATPFRNDGKLVDGDIIYSYPLASAQNDNYFKSIDFIPLHEYDEDRSDLRIAEEAVKKLKKDLDAGYEHQIIARCRTKDRAEMVHRIYQDIAPDYNPLLIHSEISKAGVQVAALRNIDSRIVVCVNMLGEGVDIPTLKIAAIHDKHQSMAVMLQFVGRITREGGANLGDATVVANVADPRISVALEQLYEEDADWNMLLREMSSNAAKEHAEFIEFLAESEPFDIGNIDYSPVSAQSIGPVFSTLFYEASSFHPKNFKDGLPKKHEIARFWINEKQKTLFIVTRVRDRVRWTKSKNLKHVEWHLFVIHYNDENGMLFLASTDKTSMFEDLAKSVGAQKQISGEQIFKSLGLIGRLVFNNLGVTKHGRRNLSFAMYTGADVKQALSDTEKVGSRKSNISGYGWEDGKQITIGCSYRGRVWSKSAGTIPAFIRWSTSVGQKLVNEDIDTKSVIENVLIPDFANTIPEFDVLSIEWPVELLSQNMERIVLYVGKKQIDWLDVAIEWQEIDRDKNSIEFAIVDKNMEIIESYQLTTNGEKGFDVVSLKSVNLHLSIGSSSLTLEEYFNNYPPLVRFVDLSELDGNLLLRAENAGIMTLSKDSLEGWDWSEVDIKKESIWKEGVERRDSIQWKTAQVFIDDGFDVVFDDDGRNEAADLVCLKIHDDYIELALVHCKFSGKSTKGGRVKDVVEVASQATRSARWPGHFKELLSHIRKRNRTRSSSPERQFFLSGSLKELSLIEKQARFKEIKTRIIIVQPGVNSEEITDNQSAVLGAAESLLKQTLNIDVEIICSK